MENIMSPETWLLITHTASLFPIGVFLWSWKQRKDPCSIFLLIKFVYCVSFSLFYHTYHVPSIPTVEDDQGVWTLLDGYASTALIFTTCLYGLRVRPPQFYITSYAVETAVLVLYLFDHTWHVMLYGLVLACTTVAVFKWRTVYRYLIKFYIWSFLTVLFGVMATVYFILALDADMEVYTYYHSLWHCTIFLTAGCCSVLRFKLDEELYPYRRRDALDSI